jgi:hypothetical protein
MNVISRVENASSIIVDTQRKRKRRRVMIWLRYGREFLLKVS